MSYAGYFVRTESILTLGHCSGERYDPSLDLGVAVRAQQNAFPSLCAKDLERPKAAVANRERLSRWVDVVELQSGDAAGISAYRAASASLCDQG